MIKFAKVGSRETAILISATRDVFQAPSVALHKVYDSITESLLLYEEFYRYTISARGVGSYYTVVFIAIFTIFSYSNKPS